MPKRLDNSAVTDGFNFDGANTVTTEQDVTEILPLEDNKVDLGSPLKKFKNVYYSSLTPDPGTGYLKLDGSTPMQANLNLDNHDLTEASAIRIPVSSTKTVIGNNFTSSTSDYTTQVGGTNTIDSSSTSAVQIGYGNDVKTSSSSAQIGNVNACTLSGNSVLIGSSNTATSAVGGIVIGDHSSSTATSAMCMGANLVNSTQSSLLISTTNNIRTNNTTCDLGTTTNPFQNVHLNGFALSSNASNRIPSVRCAFTNTTVGFSSSTTETDIIDGTLTGSLVIPPPTSAGFTTKIYQSWLYTSGAATTFTIRLKVNGTTSLTTVIPAGTVVNQMITVSHTLQLRTPSNRLYLTSTVLRDAGATIISSTIVDYIWLPFGSNTISMTGQFSDTSGQFRGDSFDMSTSYAS